MDDTLEINGKILTLDEVKSLTQKMRAKAGWDKLDKEERTKRASKGWETRRKKEVL